MLTYNANSKIRVPKQPLGCYRVNYANKIALAYPLGEERLRILQIESKITNFEGWKPTKSGKFEKIIKTNEVIFFN